MREIRVKTNKYSFILYFSALLCQERSGTSFAHSMSGKIRHTTQKMALPNVNHRKEIWLTYTSCSLRSGIGEIFLWILLILFPFACIKLGYIYGQHDIAYDTSRDWIRREDIRFFDRIDRIIGVFLLLSPLPDEGEKKQSRLLIGGKKNEPDASRFLVSGSISLPLPMLKNAGSLRWGLWLSLAPRLPATARPGPVRAGESQLIAG